MTPSQSTDFSVHLTPSEMDSAFDLLEEGVMVLDDALQLVAVNEAVQRDTGLAEPDLVGTDLADVVDTGGRQSVVEAAVTGDARSETSITLHEAGIKTVEGDTIPATVTVRSRARLLWGTGCILRYRLDDPEASHRRQTQRERLGRVNQYNSTLRKVTRSIISSTDRKDLESIVCDELAATPPYEFALLAEQTNATLPPVVEPRAWAGIDETAVAELLDPIDTDMEESCPITEAISTGSVQIKTGIDSATDTQECPATGRDVEISSVAVTPVQYSDVTYGVLAVYSARKGPFEDYEIRMLEELGSIVGYAYNAVEKNEILLSDSVVELEFRITDSASFFVRTSAAEDCVIELESVVPRTDGRLLYYHRVAGAQPERISEHARNASSVDEFEVVREAGRDSIVVFQLSETSIVEKLSVQNMNVRRIVAENGVVTLTVELSPVVDVRSAVDVIDSLYDDFELVGKRRTDRPAMGTLPECSAPLDRLTNKQRDTLLAALENGYFERPRETSAEVVADQLGIGTSTFHQHLRVGLRKLVGGAFDTEREKSAPWA